MTAMDRLRRVKWKGADSRWHDAAELLRQPKGGRRKTDEEQEADNKRHLPFAAVASFQWRLHIASVAARERTIVTFARPIWRRVPATTIVALS